MLLLRILIVRVVPLRRAISRIVLEVVLSIVSVLIDRPSFRRSGKCGLRERSLTSVDVGVVPYEGKGEKHEEERRGGGRGGSEFVSLVSTPSLQQQTDTQKHNTYGAPSCTLLLHPRGSVSSVWGAGAA